MKKARVILVSLFIGLSSGLIVPSGVTEISNNSLNNEKTILKKPKEGNLEDFDKIDETELFENNVNKSDVNERSYTIYKKIYRNQLYKSVVPRISVIPVKKSDLRKNVALKYNEAKKALSQLNPYGKQMFFPNVNSKNISYVTSIIQDDHVSPSSLSYQNISSNTTLFTKTTITDKSTFTPVFKSTKVTDIRYFDPSKKENKTKLNDINTLTSKHYHKNIIADYAVTGPTYKSSMQIRTDTEGKPNKQRNCGFLKPNQLHRASFDKQYNTIVTYSPVQIYGPNIDPSLDNMYNNNEMKLVRFIKNALVKTEIDSDNKLSSEDCSDKVDEQDELNSKSDEDDNMNEKSNMRLTTKGGVIDDKLDFLDVFNVIAKEIIP